MRRAAWRRFAPVFLSLLALHALPASAQVVIYRCTDASGAVTLQNDTPCPKGSRQVKRVMEAPPPAPAPMSPAVSPPVPPPTPMPMTPAPPVAAAPPAPEPAQAPAKRPPAPLFECHTWDRQRYFGDIAQPPPRCVPVAVTGLDGQAASAGGSACQMTEDRCQPVPEPRLCEAWTQRLRDLESASFAKASTADLSGETARVRAILHDSNCGG